VLRQVLGGLSFSGKPAGGGGAGGRGPFEGMLWESLETLRAARDGRGGHAGHETLQVLLIVSDGRILGEQKAVARLVRQAEAQGVLPVLLLLDAAAPSAAAASPAAGAASKAGAAGGGGGPAHSILDVKSVTYEDGRPKLRLLMDDYPLPYYILLRDMRALPAYLADALRQWFQLVSAH
jgi:midasin